MGKLKGRGLGARLGRAPSRLADRGPMAHGQPARGPHPFAGRAGSRARDQHARDLYVAQLGRCAMCAGFVDATLRGRSADTSAVVDHLRPWRLRPDLAHAPQNLQLVCRLCHAVCDGIEKRLWPDAEAIRAEKLARRARP